jgi:hypothetical protein
MQKTGRQVARPLGKRCGEVPSGRPRLNVIAQRNILKCKTIALPYLPSHIHDDISWNHIMIGDRHETSRA